MTLSAKGGSPAEFDNNMLKFHWFKKSEQPAAEDKQLKLEVESPSSPEVPTTEQAAPESSRSAEEMEKELDESIENIA